MIAQAEKDICLPPPLFFLSPNLQKMFSDDLQGEAWIMSVSKKKFLFSWSFYSMGRMDGESIERPKPVNKYEKDVNI